MVEKLKGLSAERVQERVAAGQVNADVSVKTKSIKRIVRDNIFTLFNLINVILCLFVLITGSYKNALFMGVIVCNTLIGIVQEIRSKKTTDKLSIIASSKATVIREGAKQEIPLEQIVQDDLLELGRGDQIPADSVVVRGSCDVNESLLTGESKLIKKTVDSALMSGSFVNSGTVTVRVVHVGAENYAAQISAEAKQHKKINSEIMNSLNGIIKFVSFIIFPLGAALFSRQFFVDHLPFNDAVLSSTAALVGMIPEGLILLTSTVLAVSVVRLARSKVLVQQLYCIETLARVDTLCLDKTGTITTGKMEVVKTEGIAGVDAAKADQGEIDKAFASLVACDEDPNETSQAIIEYYASRKVGVDRAEAVIPFSSDKKYSGVVLAGGVAYVMGAAQFILHEGFSAVSDQLNALSADARVLLLARVEGFSDAGDIVGTPQPLGFIAIHDQIRSTAKATMEYFKEQGVALKVISGDDPHTVSGIAATVGVPDADQYIDATTLSTDEQIADAIERYHVFGRVKPEQKKQFVIALQQKGHIVAMTGDGVNDTLSLKQADCSVAMASGSDAARNVAQLVLVDNDFASMPKVVAEGRRSINNLQRSASLFLVKTLLSMVLGLVFIFLPWQYPFQPIQMTLISAFTIGIPSFVLALEPNKDRVKGRFLENVIVKSIPGALVAIACVLAANVIGYNLIKLDYAQVSTLCVLLTAFVGAMLIVRLSLPFTPLRTALLVVVVGGTVLGATLLHNLFGIQPFTTDMTLVFGVLALFAAILFNFLYHVFGTWHERRQKNLV
ncbi:MAG: cation-translocating P-type ATPase [Raoultibacter sp.]